MEWSGPGFVIALIAITTIGIVFNNWIRAPHGYAPVDEWGTVSVKPELEQNRTLKLLTSENERLAGQVSRLEERIAVLERIATDPAERTARAIDGLR